MHKKWVLIVFLSICILLGLMSGCVPRQQFVRSGGLANSSEPGTPSETELSPAQNAEATSAAIQPQTDTDSPLGQSQGQTRFIPATG